MAKREFYKDKAIMLPDEDREHLARALFHLVADSFVMGVKGYNFHWNVVSPIFEDLHEMFGDDYDKILEDADSIAERIRALGFSTPGSLGTFAATTSMSDQNGLPDWQGMIQEWIEDHQHFVTEARQVQQIADGMGDNNTLALLDGMILWHDKRIWMFRSILNAGPDRFPQRQG